MSTRTIAAASVFTAITVVLNPAFTGLAFAPFLPLPLIYYLWEIPIVAAFFLIGPKYGIGITLLNMLVLLATAQGFAIQQPFYQSAAAITMLLGLYLAIKIETRKNPQQEAISKRRLLISSTALGIIFRVGIMAILAYVLFRLPGIGFNLSESTILAILPVIAIYDATLPLYTIPTGYLIAKIIRKNLKTGNKI